VLIEAVVPRMDIPPVLRALADAAGAVNRRSLQPEP